MVIMGDDKMKTLILLFLMLFTYHAECNVLGNSEQEGYWFIDHLIRTESQFNPRAYNSRTTATGLYQIVVNGNGALQYYNDFNTPNFTSKDMYDTNKAHIVAMYYLDRAYKSFGGCEVKTVNSYNVGVTGTRKGRFYFQYCTNILGYMMVSNWLEDYVVINKSSNKKLWYIRRK